MNHLPLGIYLNAHDLQNAWLNREIEALPRGSCIVFFNSDVFTSWNHPTFHAKHIPCFEGHLLCTCPYTWYYSGALTGQPRSLLWRPEFTTQYKATLSIEALKNSPRVYANTRPPIVDSDNFISINTLKEIINADVH